MGYGRPMQKVNITVSQNDLPAGVEFESLVAVDTETLGLNPLRDRLCVCQLGDGKGNAWLVQFDGEDYSAPNLRKVLEDDTLTKMFHYARFDIAVLKHYMGVQVNPIYCTKIASKLTRTYTDRHGLKALVEEIVGVNLDKGQQTSDWSAPVLSEAQKHYAASDVLYLHEMKEWLDERLRVLGRVEMSQRCFDFLPTRAELDLKGWENSDIFAHNS